MKILVIDDDMKLLKVAKTVLGRAGYEVGCVLDAEGAIEMLKESGYDFVLLDYKMPGHDGMWFLQNAKIPRSTKVILMTAHGRRDLIDRAFELGAAGYLIKPFTSENLLRHVEFHTTKQETAADQPEED